MFSGNNSGPNLSNEVQITASRIYIPDGTDQAELRDIFASHTQLNDYSYSKSDVDSKVSVKADASDVRTALGYKANSADVYTKTQVDTSLGLKANSTDVYTKTQVDTSLGLKANINNPTFTGSVLTNKVRLVGISTSSTLNDVGYLAHPTTLRLAI